MSPACAFTDVPLDMPINGLDVTIPGGKQRSVIVVKPFSDNRKDTSRCGMKKNGFNSDTADAICKTNPGEWMSQLLADELRASEFSVSTDSPPSGTSALILEGAIMKLFVEPVIGMWSGSLETDIQVKLTAKSNSGLHAERIFFGKGIKKGVIIGTLNPYHASLKRATDEILTKMVEAVFFLMNKYPQLGKVDSAVAATDFISE